MPTPNITFRRNSANAAEILLYDEVGRSPWSDYGMSDKDFLAQLDALGPVAAIDLRINSEGGLIQDGLAIYNALNRHAAKITTYVDGLAASIASVIAMSGDEIVMAENAMLMIHDAWGGICGKAEDLRREADVLDQLTGSIAGIYASRSGKPLDTFTAAMSAETWYSASAAVDAGLCSRIEANKTTGDEVNLARFNLAKFKNAPPSLQARIDADKLAAANVCRRRRLDLIEREAAD